MANKLPWFTHDHNARNDDFIRRAEDKFGHFGYAGYFKILEVLHEHGSGDTLKMSKSRLSQELRSKWPQVRLLLDFCRTSGKVEFTSSSAEVQLQIKKFRERQSKMKTKIPERNPEHSAKTPLEREGEREGEKIQQVELKTNRLTALIASVGFIPSELEDHRFPIPGDDKGRRVMDMEPSRCQWWLDRVTMDPKTTAALKYRVKLKADEVSR